MGSGIIPPEIIDEIRARSNIVEIIGNYVPLKKAGGGAWKGCCPFHNEKTPSFHVREDKQVFHCFGCHAGGDVFKFVMDKEGITFPEAAHLLAGRCGVEIPENAPGADPHEARQAANTRERMYLLNEEFARFFENNLRRFPDSPAAKYLETRKLPADMIQQFRLGAAPDGWDTGFKFGRSLGFSEEEMLRAGVLRRHEEKKRTYDLFRSRLTFAIWNELGKVVGFSARMLGTDPNVPKYVNTPETPVFKKGHLLYAIPFARQAMNASGEAILCEGQLDTIALHRAGFTQAVAPQGTGFTPDQARLLQRYGVRKVLLAFDSDNAGQKAVRAALEILLPLEMEVRMIAIPGGKDPDELVRNGGIQPLRQAVHHSLPWPEYLKNRLAGIYDLNDPAALSRALEEVAGTLLLLENSVQRELYIRESAVLFRVSQNSIEAEIRRREQKKRWKTSRPAASDAHPVPRGTDPLDNVMFTLLELALADDGIARSLAESLPEDQLRPRLPDRALNSVIASALNGEFQAAASCVSAMLNGSDPDADSRISKILVEDCSYATPSLRRKALRECLEELRRLRRHRSEEEILNEMRRTADPARKKELLTELIRNKKKHPVSEEN